MRFISLFSVLLILTMSLSPTILSGQQPGKCIALITEIKGDILVKKADKSEFDKACWGTQLFKGDQIKTMAGSEATLTLSNTGIIKIGANSSLTVSDKQEPMSKAAGDVKKISTAAMFDLNGLLSKKESKKETGALAGLRSGDTEELFLLNTPCKTLIKTGKPEFSWISSKPFDKYVVNLYGSNGLLWSRKVTGNTMKYPDNEKELSFGESYFWNVEGEDVIDNIKSYNSKFTIIPGGQSKEVSARESLISDTFRNEPGSCSFHSALGAYYLSQGLLEDALKEFQIISEINSDAPLPHEILGSIYSELGNKDKAIEELQKALVITKSKDK
jgi:hypothetical protein